jgi:hypothetical protein
MDTNLDVVSLCHHVSSQKLHGYFKLNMALGVYSNLCLSTYKLRNLASCTLYLNMILIKNG